MNTTSPPDQPSPDDASLKPKSGGPQQPAKKDDLPEREPLTPELVEDEALRGDFMLRWALVLVALLCGCTAIAETQTLVHVKSGQYTLDNLMPARTGIYSATAEDRPWHNLSWLFDVALAAVYAAGGGIGLSIFKALLAAAIFWSVTHTNRKDVATWWGTICAGLALIVCHRQLTARPEIITLLGLAITLRLLHRWREDRQTKYLKGLVVLFLLWSNMDPGMFYGLAVVVLYAVGETTGNWLGYAGLDSDADRQRLWVWVGACVAVTLLNPFGWNALLSPVVRYATEYPEWQTYFPLRDKANFETLQYYPLWQPEFWSSIDAAAVAGLVLAGTALISFVLNFRRLDFGDFIVWLAFVAFAGVAAHELAAAAVVSAVLATLNAQQWYQHTFRQTYSVETSELVFSRGGRALTVLALFGLAYLSGSGIWRAQTRADLGFDSNLAAAIESFDDVLQDSYDDKPFNFVLWQGDVLVWNGKKPFIDSRLPLYAGTGEDDLIAIHKECRNQLRNADRPGSAGRQWKATLDRFDIAHVMPRMDSRINKAAVSYAVVYALMRSPDWQLTRFGATAAVFYRTDRDDAKLTAYLRHHRFDLVKAAFRTQTADAEVRFDWARGPSLSERWLRRPADFTPNSVEAMRNHMELLSRAVEGTLPRMYSAISSDRGALAAALAHLIIRNGNASLATQPLNGDIHRMLGYAYYVLATRIERGDVGCRERRFVQAAAALQQALIIAPDDEAAWQMQAFIQDAQNAFDLAIESIDRCIELLDARPELTKRDQNLRAGLERRKQELLKAVLPGREAVEKVRKNLGEGDAGRATRFQLARGVVMQYGCVKLAIELIEEDREMIDVDPMIAYFYIQQLQRAGRAQDAFELAQELETKLENQQRPIAWRTVDAFSALTRADYVKAVRIWTLAADELANQQFDSYMTMLPFSMRSPSAARVALQQRVGTLPNPASYPPTAFSTDQTQSLSAAMYDIPFSMASLKMQVALSQLETGNPQRAADTLRELLKIAPHSPLRPLAGFYLQLLTGEQLAPLTKPATKKAGPTAPGKSPNNTADRPPVEAPKPKR